MAEKCGSLFVWHGQITVADVLYTLGAQRIASLLVEGGQAVNGAFLQARAIQKMIGYVSLKLIGGNSAPTPIGGQGFATMDQAVRLGNTTVELLDESDVRISGYPLWEK